MGHIIDTNRYDNEVSSVVNTQNAKIKTAIDNFNAQLNILGNGSTWKGGMAAENVGNLVNCYNTYKDGYSTFVTKLSQDCASLFARVNAVVSTNHGTQLTYTDINSLTFDNPKVSDLSSAVESGSVDQIETCATNLQQYAKEIKDGYIAIKGAFELIGNGSQILDTSDSVDNPANTLKNKVIDAIDTLKQVDENAFKTYIENLNTAAKNIRNM